MISRDKSSRLGSLEEHSVIGEKKYHKTTIANALAQLATEAWWHLPVETIGNVFGKEPNVLQKIINDEGRNDLVEGRR
jgi:hypothetical protein